MARQLRPLEHNGNRNFFLILKKEFFLDGQAFPPPLLMAWQVVLELFLRLPLRNLFKVTVQQFTWGVHGSVSSSEMRIIFSVFHFPIPMAVTVELTARLDRSVTP